jgi:hypothetical protein
VDQSIGDTASASSVLVAGHGWMSAPAGDGFAGMGVAPATQDGRSTAAYGGQQLRGLVRPHVHIPAMHWSSEIFMLLGMIQPQ